jgi:hypothetical protein
MLGLIISAFFSLSAQASLWSNFEQIHANGMATNFSESSGIYLGKCISKGSPDTAIGSAFILLPSASGPILIEGGFDWFGQASILPSSASWIAHKMEGLRKYYSLISLSPLVGTFSLSDGYQSKIDIKKMGSILSLEFRYISEKTFQIRARATLDAAFPVEKNQAWFYCLYNQKLD